MPPDAGDQRSASPLEDAAAAGFRIGHGRNAVFVFADGDGITTGELAIRLGAAIIQQGYAALEVEEQERDREASTHE